MESDIRVLVLLNLLNELRKLDKMRGLNLLNSLRKRNKMVCKPRILSLFLNLFNKFNKT